MNRVFFKFLSVLLVAITFSCLAYAQAGEADPSPKPDQMSLWRARRILRCEGVSKEVPCAAAKITDEEMEWDEARGRNKQAEHYTVDLKSLDKLTAACNYHGFGKARINNCEVHTSDGKALAKENPLKLLYYTGYYFAADAANEKAVEVVHDRAELFVSALNRLHENAIHPESPLRNFSKVAAAWRTLSTKPSLSEAANLHRLLAEDEVKQKHPTLALYHYETALETDPTWPEGYFNSALIAAELDRYAQAAEHMGHYLELMPDAPDAQKARDRMAVWKYKAEQQKK